MSAEPHCHTNGQTHPDCDTVGPHGHLSFVLKIGGDAPQDAPQRPTDDAEARQTGWERDRAYRALQQAEQRLEMLGRPDMAREVRTIRARLALGR
jgi:hypothetical protein